MGRGGDIDMGGLCVIDIRFGVGCGGIWKGGREVVWVGGR